MNLISGTHDFCERREYAFNILLEYSIITFLFAGTNEPRWVLCLFIVHWFSLFLFLFFMHDEGFSNQRLMFLIPDSLSPTRTSQRPENKCRKPFQFPLYLHEFLMWPKKIDRRSSCLPFESDNFIGKICILPHLIRFYFLWAVFVFEKFT